MIDNADIEVVPQNVEKELLDYENVVGVGFGAKETDAEGLTDEPAVVVYVTQKLGEGELKKDEVVPKEVEIDGKTYRTDVVESGVVSAQQKIVAEPPVEFPEEGMLEEEEAGVEEIPSSLDRRAKWRPAPAGVACAHVGLRGQGTIGTPPLYHLKSGKMVFLTNAHVAALSGKAKKGDDVLQPGGNGDTADKIGTLHDFSKISFGASSNNRTDAALVEVKPDHMQADVFELHEDLRGWTDPVVGRTYTKSGRTTGVTHGRLRSRNATFNVNFGSHGVAKFSGLDVYEAMTLPGDSGSMVGQSKGDGFYGTGLHFAGGGGVSLSIPIKAVQDEFGPLTPLTSQDLVDPQDLRIVRTHFKGQLAANGSTYRWSGPWAPEYAAHFEGIATTPGRMIRCTVDRTYLSSSGGHYYLLKLENLSSEATGFEVKCAIMR